MEQPPNTPRLLDTLNKMSTPHRRGVGIISLIGMVATGFSFTGIGTFILIRLFNSNGRSTQTGSLLFAALFPLLGVAMLVGGPIAYARSKKRDEQITQLVMQGSKVQAIIKRHTIRRNKNDVTIQFVLEGPDPVTGQTRSYTSDWIGGNPSYAVEAYPLTPITLDVYVSPMNPKDYYVDIRDIPLSPSATVGSDSTPPPTVAL